MSVRWEGDTLVFGNGTRRTFVEEGVDEGGAYLLMRHVEPRPGQLAGAHWHPVLRETWRVEEGRMRFRVGGREGEIQAGEEVTALPREVHEFWNAGEGPLVVAHEIRPPGRHRAMFELWHRLDGAGKTNRQGVPRNPLWLGLLWERMDGYIAGPPAAVQRIVFGGLARLARLFGCGG